ncbi:hypothetical protein [Brachybacterium ginsengisoli]|uniref:hypothetical protein n=1 Tax=Brachybacterium ginsengisoli TaxID=1331682 RepID=UPI00125F91D2|nr:hypothetical protein [Brachybacterium ginsengisoli]
MGDSGDRTRSSGRGASGIARLGPPEAPLPRARRGGRRPRVPASLAVLSAFLLVCALSACDPIPDRPDGGTDEEPTTPPASAAPMDPAEVAAAESTPVDPTWLCRPGEEKAPSTSTTGGTLTPLSVRAEGNDLEVSGPFHLEPEQEYRGFTPSGVLLPAHPENRGVPAPGWDEQLGVEGAPVPPIVVRERVEVAGDGPAPSAVTARLTLGTCDDAPLPDGQYLLRLSGGDLDGPGRREAGWGAREDVLVDVVGGAAEAVPGAVSAPSGEIPADLSPLHCGATLAPRGDGDGLGVEVAEPTTEVSTVVPDEEVGSSVGAEVTATSPDLGSMGLFHAVVLTDPGTGTVVAGARNATTIPLQWMDADGVTRTERAWTSQGACGPDALGPGTYEAHGAVAAVDADGATHIVLSKPWTVTVVEEDPAT